jgi:hypothetical protein
MYIPMLLATDAINQTLKISYRWKCVRVYVV